MRKTAVSAFLYLYHLESRNVSSDCPDLRLLGATSHAATSAPARRTGDAAGADATERQEHPVANEADEGRQEGGGGAVHRRRGILALPVRVGP